MNKRRWLGVAILGIVLLSIGGYWILQGNKEPKFIDFHDQKTSLNFKYSEKLQTVQLKKEEKKDKFIVRLQNGSKEKSDLLIRVSYEEGLRTVTTLTKAELIPLLLSNAEKSLPQTFPEFQLETKREIEIANHESGEMIFTYTGPSKKQVKRRLLIVDKDGSTAIYIAMESATENYETVNSEYFEPLVQSVMIR